MAARVSCWCASVARRLTPVRLSKSLFLLPSNYIPAIQTDQARHYSASREILCSERLASKENEVLEEPSKVDVDDVLTGANVKQNTKTKVSKRRKTLRVFSAKIESVLTADHSNHETIQAARSLLDEIKMSMADTATVTDKNHMVEVDLQINKVATAPASLLGLSAKELTYRYDFLKLHNFPPILALRIALSFPTIISWDETTAVRMINVLQKHGVALFSFFSDPYLFSLDASVVDANLAKLKGVGFSADQLNAVLFKHSVILGFPLREHTVQTLATFSESVQDKRASFLPNILKGALQTLTVQHERNQNFDSGVKFLKDVGVNMSAVLGKCPLFFEQTADQLWDCFDFLTGKPLFFDVDSLRQLVEKEPQVFILANQGPFQDLVLRLRAMMDDGNRLFSVFMRRGKLFSKPEVVMQKITILQRWKFSDEQIQKLLIPHSLLFVADRDNLQERLRFILGKGDLTVDDLCRHAGFLTVRFSVMKWRLGFLREKQRLDALNEYDTSTILSGDEETFAVNVCQATLDDYDDYVKKHAYLEKSAAYLEKRTLKRGTLKLANKSE